MRLLEPFRDAPIVVLWMVGKAEGRLGRIGEAAEL